VIRLLLALFAALLGVASTANAQAYRSGILNQPAPVWSVQKWINLPEGRSRIEIDDYRGKVLYLFCFQSWCPGCHSHGFPTLQKVISEFEGNDDLAFVALQTVFEGFQTNTFEAAIKTARDFALDIPVGQSGEDGVRSVVVDRYRTGGTPWTIIIDREGIVRYNDFRITVSQATTIIRDLLARPAESPKPSSSPLPASRAGLELIGKPLDLDGLEWIEPESAKHGDNPAELTGKVTLVRWFTSTCPFCARSLPAIMKLKEEFDSRGFHTLAVYHPKPPRSVGPGQAIAAAARLGYEGPLAMDPAWSTLRRIYLSSHPSAATSVSFLLDREGKVRYVHPGPEFRSTDDPRFEEANRDYEEVRRAIEALLAEDTGRS
jgi:thiol-disulfide isomerase/thioredoxin